MPAETAYHGALGDEFAKNADTSPYNAFTDRPAMLKLAGDVAGLRILDVGCGAGHYAAELVARGAQVVGIDGSSTMLEHARTRVAAEFRQHDLEQPFSFAPDASFDGVICALVLHHITNRRQLLAELHRVLRPGGWLLLSTTHPTSDWRYHGGSYYSDDWVELTIIEGKPGVRYQRMSLELFITEVLAPGFALERLVEPRPGPELKAKNPERYARLHERPCFLAVRLRADHVRQARSVPRTKGR
jgi:SAM-dependent methyltransferase